MTAAFNLSQFANNLNSSGQLDATDGLSGLLANLNLASSGTASSSTYLRGDRTWASLAQEVVQIQYQLVNTQSSYNLSASWTGNLQSVSITPTSASNKILCICAPQGWLQAINGAGDTPVYTRLLRNGSVIAYGEAGSITNPNAHAVAWLGQLMYIDNPATTSAVTYTYGMAGRSDGDYWALYFCNGYITNQYRNNGTLNSYLICMEIAV